VIVLDAEEYVDVAKEPVTTTLDGADGRTEGMTADESSK
jgi:hypothetical protein